MTIPDKVDPNALYRELLALFADKCRGQDLFHDKECARCRYMVFSYMRLVRGHSLGEIAEASGYDEAEVDNGMREIANVVRRWVKSEKVWRRFRAEAGLVWARLIFKSIADRVIVKKSENGKTDRKTDHKGDIQEAETMDA